MHSTRPSSTSRSVVRLPPSPPGRWSTLGEDKVLLSDSSPGRSTWFLPKHRSEVGSWLIVDATSGQVFRAQDHSQKGNFSGTGNVFNPDPISTSGASYGDPGYVDGNDADTPQLNDQLQRKYLKNITFDDGIYTLDGPYAQTVDYSPPYKGLFSQTTPDFSFNREEDGFKAVNCYYHIDTMMRHANEHLGFSIMAAYTYPVYWWGEI
jgi:hypothetical protein